MYVCMKERCANNRCKCRKAGLTCTDLCSCSDTLAKIARTSWSTSRMMTSMMKMMMLVMTRAVIQILMANSTKIL